MFAATTSVEVGRCGSVRAHCTIMRSAIVCVFFILIIRKECGAQHDDFRPTPIPLTEWHHDRHRQGRAGTLHETFKTDTPPTVAAVPAHYWEDALRHSVYLTLVRDKIDQLIAKGEVISGEGDNKHVSKEVDDHDLWEKIKMAPFDRVKEEEPSSIGDVTIMAKGKLVEEKGGFRFAEDDKSKDKEKCNEDCMQDVKAIWSVKRVRQRDQETSPGRYHYELTFSVISQTPKKQRKPYENPIRTFTVRESSTPYGITKRAQEIEKVPPQIHTPRPARAIWFHKNIVPTQPHPKSQPIGALDRIFSSLFSDDDDRSYEQPAPKYKPHPYGQHAKVGYVGAPTDQHQQINNAPYQYKPPQVKYGRPQQAPPQGYPLNNPPVPQHQYHQQHPPYHHQYQPSQPAHSHQNFEMGSIPSFNNQNYYNLHDHRIDNNYSTLKTTLKTTRPAVLPTPLPPLPTKDQSAEVTNVVSYEHPENTTSFPEFNSHKTTNRYKPTTSKVSYFTDHVRPPIYNAPPGVFVTMDKKPFKPMPPLKLIHPKGHKTNKPIDFRPSPQFSETQNSEQDTFSDTAFRPITVHYANHNFTSSFESNKKTEHKHRKTTSGVKKPNKKHGHVKSHPSSTVVPDIITAQALPEVEPIETMDWTSILNSFTKTTPMASQTEKVSVTEIATPDPVFSSETSEEIITTTTTELPETTPIVTSPKPRKRTRPPPKFTKPEKIKKHKRITTTSTTTTAPVSSTRATWSKSSERPLIRKSPDLTPQASSAPTGGQKTSWEPANKTQPLITSTTTTTTTSTTSTTTAATTTTTKPPTTVRVTSTTESKPWSTTTLPRNRNRFRQSTLMLKGTSVKHDKWSVIGIQKNNSTSTAAPSSQAYRRKGSNFHGYSTTASRIRSGDSASTNVKQDTTKLNEINYETSTNYDPYESNSVIPLGRSDEENNVNYDNEDTSSTETNDGETSDQEEFIFQTTTVSTDKSNDVTSFEEPMMSTLGVNPVSQMPPKNKTKCKKKKNQDDDSGMNVTPSMTSESPSTNDILDEILKLNLDNDSENDTSSEDLENQASLHREDYQKMDDDIKDFLSILDGKRENSDISLDDHFGMDDNDNIEFEDVDERDDETYTTDDEETYDNDENVDISSRQNDDSKSKRPFSFLDLLA